MTTAQMSEQPPSEEKTKEEQQREKTFNGLTAKEWTQLSRNVWRDLSSAREDYHKDHGATFSEKLARRLIKIYSGEGDLILDPFVGTGTTVIAARKMERPAVGIELVDRFVETARDQLKQSAMSEYTGEGEYEQRVVHGDCRDVLDYVERESVQAMITSPPYANLIHKAKDDRDKRDYSIIKEENNSTIGVYSDDRRDFGNLSYETYIEEIGGLMGDLYGVTRPGGYNIWIVKDFRDTESGRPYIPLHSDIARMGEEAGFDYHDLIIWDQNQHRRLVLNGYPSTFYTNLNSSFFVVLRKS